MQLKAISPSEKFAVNDPKAREFLAEHGYVVFSDVASQKVNNSTILFINYERINI